MTAAQIRWRVRVWWPAAALLSAVPVALCVSVSGQRPDTRTHRYWHALLPCHGDMEL